MKKIILTLFIFTAVFSAYGQSTAARPIDFVKKTYDPYVAESKGFESLFVNPAGMAGLTDIFTLDIEAGLKGSFSSFEKIKLLIDNQSALQSDGAIDELDAADAESVMTLIAESANQSDLDAITGGTSMAGMTADQIAAHLATHELTSGEITQIQTNVTNNPDAITNTLENLKNDLIFQLDTKIKLGTLIKGFGLGAYGNLYTLINGGSFGFDDVMIETGLKAGYGFKLGPVQLGVSGSFAFIGSHPDPLTINLSNPFDFVNTTVNKGYAWGIDVGAIWEPFEWMAVGAVMTDIIGSYSDAGTGALSSFFSVDTKKPFTYNFNLDLDLGITFKPKLHPLFVPSFSLDYYDFIGLFYEDTRPATFLDAIDKHMRVGASINMLKILNVRAQYYNQFFSVGAGVDLLFIEVFGEFMFKHTFDDVGGAVLVKLHF